MNAVWALDFMRDTLYSGKVFGTLNVIDEANRAALGLDVAVSIPAARVIAFLTQMIDLHGRPRTKWLIAARSNHLRCSLPYL